MEECKKCPVFAKCIWNHGGAMCKALRKSYGLDETQKPLTNADRIRGMNDKELAEFLTKHDFEQNRLRLEGNGVVLTATQLADLVNAMLCAWQDWLRKPVSATPYVSDMRQHSGLLEEE